MKKYIVKLSILLYLIITFTFLYSVLDNSHFAGLNPIEDKLKENEIEEKTNELIHETNKEGFYTFTPAKEPEEEIQNNIEKVAEDEKQKVKKGNFQQKFFDRLYFSIITACLVGYGDIYPSTNLLKAIVSIQTLSTICLILY